MGIQEDDIAKNCQLSPGFLVQTIDGDSGGGNKKTLERQASASAIGREGKVVARLRPDNTVYIPGLTEVGVGTMEEVIEVYKKGNDKRAMTATAMNSASSRSHMLLTVDVCKRDDAGKETSGRLVLVDLAGSERIKKSEAKGAAMKEAQVSNQLFCFLLLCFLFLACVFPCSHISRGFQRSLSFTRDMKHREDKQRSKGKKKMT